MAAQVKGEAERRLCARAASLNELHTHPRGDVPWRLSASLLLLLLLDKTMERFPVLAWIVYNDKNNIGRVRFLFFLFVGFKGDK